MCLQEGTQGDPQLDLFWNSLKWMTLTKVEHCRVEQREDERTRKEEQRLVEVGFAKLAHICEMWPIS